MVNLTHGGLSGGYRKYLQELVPLLSADPAVTDLLMAVPPGQEGMLGRYGELRTWGPNEPWRGFPDLAASVRSWKPHVVFVPTARWIDCGAPCVVMVRNMEPMMPASPGAGLIGWGRNRVRALVARRAAERATRVIAVSGFVRDHLVSRWGIGADKVGVVPHGVSTTAASEPPEVLQAVVGKPFLFAAGSLEHYRGLEDAVGALALLSGPSDGRIGLVIAGAGSAAYQARVAGLADCLGVTGRVHWAGQLGAAQMAWGFEQCAAFLMTSRVEACPNTALEAMAHGAVCVSSTNPPMPEFFAGAAAYYPAGDVPALAARIRGTREATASAREAARLLSRERAAQFTWATTARLTVDELRRALGKNSNDSVQGRDPTQDPSGSAPAAR
ncbi:MAG: glycosyltransferase family 4 protein [Gemmatimonadota bacterium]